MTNMDIAEFQQTPEFLALRPRQRAFVLSFIETEGNLVESAALNYNTGDGRDVSRRSRENARTFAYKVLRSERVRRALWRYHGIDSHVATLQERILKLQDQIYRDVQDTKVPVERVTEKRKVVKDLEAQLEDLNAPAPVENKRPATQFTVEGPDEPQPENEQSKQSSKLSNDPDEMFAKVEAATRRKY